MTFEFVQTDAEPDCGVSTFCATGSINTDELTSQLEVDGTPGSTPQAADIDSNQTTLISFMQSTGGVGEETWDAGTWSIPFNVTDSQSNLTWTNVWVCRVSDTCGHVATIGQTSPDVEVSGGVITHTVSGSEHTGDASDDVYIVAEVHNDHGHTDRTIQITPDQTVVSPIEAPVETVSITAAGTDADVATAAVTSAEPDPFFEVTITGWDDPVVEGDPVTVNATITNTGGAGAQDIELHIITPVPQDGLTVWYDAAALDLSDNDPVSEWPDASGEGHDATQPTAANQPTYRTNQIAGNAVVEFDGSADFMVLPDSVDVGADSFDIFAVVATESSGMVYMSDTDIGDPTEQFVIFRDESNNPDWRVSRDADRGDLDFTTSWTDGNVHLINGEYDHEVGDMRVYLDGEQDAENPDVGDVGALNLDGTTVNIGRDTRDSQYFDGPFCELLIYDRALGADDRAVVVNYLTDKWGIE